jgi:large subunit ribosomal protein L17
MRHRKFGRKLGRTSSHRKAMMRNLVGSLLRHGRVITTMPKAKAARPDAERLITIAKVESVHNRRKVFAYLQDRSIVDKLFGEIAVRFRGTNGGYTAIHRLAKNRLGDNASQVVWQIVSWEPGTKPKGRKRKKARKEKRKAAPPKEKADAPAPEAGEADEGKTDASDEGSEAKE